MKKNLYLCSGNKRKGIIMNTISIDSRIYGEALDLMEDIVSDSYSNIHVPADEDGRDARVEKYLQ